MDVTACLDFQVLMAKRVIQDTTDVPENLESLVSPVHLDTRVNGAIGDSLVLPEKTETMEDLVTQEL